VHANGLFRCEVVVGRILHAQVRTLEEIGIHGGDVRKAGIAVVPPADSRLRQLGETHHEVVVRLGIVVAQPDFLALRMFWYRRRQNVKPSGLSGVRVDRYLEVSSVGEDGGPLCCAAHDGQSSAIAKASANRIHRADARVRRMCASYNDYAAFDAHCSAERWVRYEQLYGCARNSGASRGRGGSANAVAPWRVSSGPVHAYAAIPSNFTLQPFANPVPAPEIDPRNSCSRKSRAGRARIQRRPWTIDQGESQSVDAAAAHKSAVEVQRASYEG